MSAVGAIEPNCEAGLSELEQRNQTIGDAEAQG